MFNFPMQICGIQENKNSVKCKNGFLFKKKNKKTKRYKKMLKELQAVSRGEDLDSWKRVTRASNNGIICSIW